MSETFDPLRYNDTDITLSNGDLTATSDSSATDITAFTTAQLSSGKYYWEFFWSSVSSVCCSGFDTDGTCAVTQRVGIDDGYSLMDDDSSCRNYRDGSYIGFNQAYGSSDTIIQIAVDIDNGDLWYGIDGVWGSNGTGDPANGTDPDRSGENLGSYITPGVSFRYAGDQVTFYSDSVSCTYSAPSGFDYINPPAPGASTNDPSGVTSSSATLNGTVDGIGDASNVDVYFEWGTTTSYGNTTSTQTVSSTGSFSDSISGLTDMELYHYRAVLDDNGTLYYGSDVEFYATSSEILQGSDTKKSNCTASSEYSASYPAENAWDGIVGSASGDDWISDSSGAQTDGSCWIQIALTEAKSIIGIRFAASGDSTTRSGRSPKRVNIKGSDTGSFSGEEVTLISDYQFDAEPGVGEWSSWASFTGQTASYVRMEILECWDDASYACLSELQLEAGTLEDSVSTNPASDVTETSATLNGTLDSLVGESSVDVYFEWGTTTSYGNTTAIQTLSTPGAFSDGISGLTVDQVYHFRAAVTDGVDTWYGSDAQFTATTEEPAADTGQFFMFPF